MPYVVCSRCNLRTYSAALWSMTEVCPSCGTELPRKRAKLVPISTHPRFARERTPAPPPPTPPPSAPKARPD